MGSKRNRSNIQCLLRKPGEKSSRTCRCTFPLRFCCCCCFLPFYYYFYYALLVLFLFHSRFCRHRKRKNNRKLQGSILSTRELIQTFWERQRKKASVLPVGMRDQSRAHCGSPCAHSSWVVSTFLMIANNNGGSNTELLPRFWISSPHSSDWLIPEPESVKTTIGMAAGWCSSIGLLNFSTHTQLCIRLITRCFLLSFLHAAEASLGRLVLRWSMLYLYIYYIFIIASSTFERLVTQYTHIHTSC